MLSFLAFLPVTFTLDNAYDDLYMIKIFSSTGQLVTTNLMDVYISATTNYSAGRSCGRGLALLDSSPALPLALLCPPYTGAKYVTLVRDPPGIASGALTVDEVKIFRSSE